MTDLNEKTNLAELQLLPFWNPDEIILSAEPAGESNMNLVLRIKTSQRRLILKQSKPYVRKYPQIPAPIERIEVEHEFFKLISTDETLSRFSPEVLFFDANEHVLITGDLGNSADFSEIYSRTKALKIAEIIELTNFLSRLHALEVSSFPENMAMRKLNHEHIFRFPFLEENGFDLDQIQEGLQEISLIYKRDQKLKSRLEELGNRYLSTGNVLLHGDFYPGSWLDTASGIKIIDTEFGFLGDPEFDLGVMLAHLDLSLQSNELKETVISMYAQPFDLKLANQYRGVEILRRLMGIAQLPLNLSLSEKKVLLDMGAQLVS